jgi:hypothetical protein
MPDSAIAPRETTIASSRTRHSREDAPLFERHRRIGDRDARDEPERAFPAVKRAA